MEGLLFVLLVIVILGFTLVLYFLNRKFESLERDEEKDILMNWLKEMRGSVEKNTEVVSTRLLENNKAINERLDRAAEVIGGVQKELGQMSEIGRRLEEFQDFLRSPKLRGNLGEQVLSDLLAQSIPRDKYEEQYQFRSGQVVDRVIRTAVGLIPVDSKFPLENFQRYVQSDDEKERDRLRNQFARDIRKHIRAISEKYILPQEGTTDFAIMYVPSEAVAYEIIVNHPEVMDYARQRRVILASPNQFNHILRMVLLSFEQQQVRERATEILAALRAIRGEAEKFGEDLRLLVSHITNAKNRAGDVESSFERLLGKLSGVERIEGESTPQLPLEEE